MMPHRQSRGTLVRPSSSSFSLRHRRPVLAVIRIIVVVLSSSRVCHVFGRARDPERDNQKHSVVHPSRRRRTEQRHAGGEIEDDGHASSSSFFCSSTTTEQPPTTTPRCCFGVRVVVMVVVVVLVLVLIAIIARRIILIIVRRHRGPFPSAGKVCCVLTERDGSTQRVRVNKSTQKRNPNFDTLHWFRVFNDETSSSFPRFRFTHHHYITFSCRCCCSGWSYLQKVLPRFCSTRRRLLTTTTGFFGSLSLFSLFERPERERERGKEETTEIGIHHHHDARRRRRRRRRHS